MSEQRQKSTPKGEAFERLLLALVAESPVRPGRSELIESNVLAAAHRSLKDLAATSDAHETNAVGSLTEPEKKNASKALGRMVGSEALREIIVPNGSDERINLPESGLVAISISLPVLNAAFDEWENSERNGPEPSQEAIAEEIRTKTIEWIIKNRSDAELPLFLKDVWIVHGSNSIDMLVLVIYRHSRSFMRYVREVVQRVKGVLGTQTMQVSNNLSVNHSHSKKS